MDNATPETLHTIARRARIRGVRASLVTTLIVAGVAYAISDIAAAEGALLGGMAGALGFWSMSLRLERIATIRPERLQVAATMWTFYRLGIYTVFLFIAYRLDTQDMHGLLAGIGGLLSTRFAVLFVALRNAPAANQSSSTPN